MWYIIFRTLQNCINQYSWNGFSVHRRGTTLSEEWAHLDFGYTLCVASHFSLSLSISGDVHSQETVMVANKVSNAHFITCRPKCIYYDIVGSIWSITSLSNKYLSPTKLVLNKLYITSGILKLFKNLAATSKFKTPEGWHEARSTHSIRGCHTTFYRLVNLLFRIFHPWITIYLKFDEKIGNLMKI